MRKTIETSIAALLLGCAVVACSGGGGSAVPSSPNNPTLPVSHTRQSVVFTLTVPQASKSQSARTPKYVSASTQSISIVETDGTAAANPAVVQNTTPGSSNCTSSSNGTTCTISVLANTGADSFTVKAFDQPNAAGNLLSQGTVRGTVVAGTANSFPLTLGGTVATLSLITPEAYPQVGGTTTVSAQAKDAGGNTIIGSFDSPISLSSTGSATLSASTLASSSDSVTVTLGASQTAAFTVSASVNAASASLTLNPSSSVLWYPIAKGSTDVTGFQMIAGNDGNLYYSTLGVIMCSSSGTVCMATSGHIGQFNPATGADTEIPVSYEPVGLYQTADGAVWSALTQVNMTSGARVGYVGHVAGAFTSANMNVVPLPLPSPNHSITLARDFALANDGNLYLTGAGDHNLYKIPVSNPTTTSITAVPFPTVSTPPNVPQPGSFYPMLEGITTGADGNLYIANFGYYSGDALRYAPATGAVTPLPFPDTTQTLGGRYIVSGSDGNLYVSTGTFCSTSTTSTCASAFYKLTTSGTYSRINLPDTLSAPDFLAAGNGEVGFADLGEMAVGAYDIKAGELRDYPMQPNTNPCCTVNRRPDAVAFTSDGSMWILSYGQTAQNGTLGIGHVVMTNNWSVWPSQNISLAGTGAAGEQLIGIMESGDSGPFTVTSSDNTIATMVSTGSSHDFELVGNAAGSCTVTITDKNGRRESIAVSVTSTSGVVQIRRAAARASKGGLL